MTYTKTSPFLRFFALSGVFCAGTAELPTTSGKNRHRGAQTARFARCAVAPVRFAPGGLPGCPSAWPCAALGAGQGSLWRALRFAASGGRAPGLRPVLVAPVCVGRAASAAQWGALR